MKYAFFISLCISVVDCLYNFLNCYHYGDYEGCDHYLLLAERQINCLMEAYSDEEKESES